MTDDVELIQLHRMIGVGSMTLTDNTELAQIHRTKGGNMYAVIGACIHVQPKKFDWMSCIISKDKTDDFSHTSDNIFWHLTLDSL